MSLKHKAVFFRRFQKIKMPHDVTYLRHAVEGDGAGLGEGGADPGVDRFRPGRVIVLRAEP